MGQLKKIKYTYSFLAVCMTAVGGVMLIWPGIAADTLYKICGVLMLIFGLVKIAGYFSKDLFQLAFQFDFAMGIVSSVIGCLMIFHTSRMAEFIAVCVGIFMLSDALLKIQTALDARRFGIHIWWSIFILAVCAAGTGILLLVIPLKGTQMIIRIIGLNIVVYGGLNLLIVQSTLEKKHKKDM